MELATFVRLMREEFAIYAEPWKQPYGVRFVGSPYNTFLPDCRSLVIFAHNRGTMISPISIQRVLDKFGKTSDEFRAAYNAFFCQLSLPREPDTAPGGGPKPS